MFPEFPSQLSLFRAVISGVLSPPDDSMPSIPLVDVKSPLGASFLVNLLVPFMLVVLTV